MARYVKTDDPRVFAPRWLDRYPNLAQVKRTSFFSDSLVFPELRLIGYYDHKGALEDVFHMDDHVRIPFQHPDEVRIETMLEEMSHVERAHYEADKADAFRHRWVYFVGPVDGPIKIGVAYSVESRLCSLQTGSPLILHMWAKCKGGDNKEAAYHFQFAQHRMHGEWFQRVPEIEAEIERLNATQPKEQP